MDGEGLDSTFTNEEYFLHVLGLNVYPTPAFAAKVMEDFFACNPKAPAGSYQWAKGVWRSTSNP